ncbi:SGNH/GDSL hydrolase family protein [Limisphaera sp. VF-2]|jgi:lysophospholipase L1-like esterase|uniref:SGNH/GDSL hydrolase family protein n=1 Tax=Limisphaera sp. VF-2 TaxID=3400418 RepID=UPI001777A2ED
MQNAVRFLLLGLLLAWGVSCRTPQAVFQEASLPGYAPAPVPPQTEPWLRPGDRLAICGDSITEQKMYSRILEDYLTMCVPQYGVWVRQYGWSGEKASGFLGRMTNDCLRFAPTLATTCYGMNDHEYRPYEERIGQTYRQNLTAVVRAFKAHGTRVIVGSPGCVGKVPHWVKTANGTVSDLNRNLGTLRNIALEVARQEGVGFADVFLPMLRAGELGRQRFGTNFMIAGNDGVHPDWAGQAVMAYAFLKSMGLDGHIGTFTVDLSRNTIHVTAGHEVLSTVGRTFTLRSHRYPFASCLPREVTPPGVQPAFPPCDLPPGQETASLKAAFELVPFHQELNRLMLVARNGSAARYRVRWGDQSKVFTADELRRGVNLAAEFDLTPFAAAFARVDAAVAAKQAFETRQVKQVFHGAEGRADMEAAVRRTEAERNRLVAAIHAAFVPVTHTLSLVPES